MVKQPRILKGSAVLLAIIAFPWCLAALGQRAEEQAANQPQESAHGPAAPQNAARPADTAPALAKPKWKAGDTWTIVTLTEPVQKRNTGPQAKPVYVTWKFRVAGIETIAGHACYRIDIECLATGRVRPQTSVWCDQQTLFLRQFQTQMAVGGQYRLVQESYEPGPEGHSPVVTPINALPLGLPAFLPPGAKRASPVFRYTSRPAPAGSKSTGLMTFAHETTQLVQTPVPKSLTQIPREHADSLQQRPVAEVHLQDYRQTVVQLWQQGSPWPVYTNNGRTQAWLVADKPADVQ